MGNSGAITGATGGSVSAPLVKRAIVIIHGAGNWDKDYTVPMVQTIKRFVRSPEAKQFDGLEVNYSSVINSQAWKTAQAATVGRSKSAVDLFIQAMVQENLAAQTGTLPVDQLLRKLFSGSNPLSALIAGFGAAFLSADNALDALAKKITGSSLDAWRDNILQAIGPTIEDVCLYLDNDGFRQDIKATLIAKLQEAQQYDDVILVSHSLGTVVAFDVLNEWTDAKPTITAWFTMGCPLKKVLALDKALSLKPDRPSQLINSHVRRWFNVYNTFDFVANPLSPIFAIIDNPLNPIRRDSVYDIFVQAREPNIFNPISAHDYFGNENALKLIADAIETF